MAALIVDGMSVFKTLAGQAAHLDRGYAYSFLTQLNAAVKKLSPEGILVCWEGGFEHRTKLLPGYKASRQETPELIRNERTEIQRLLTRLGADQFYAPGREADDMIAFLANTLEEDVIIMSADKDLLQLVGPRVSVYQKIRKTGNKSERVVITEKNFQHATGWPDPATYLRAHCALGDAVDQIPKIEGVGEGVIHAYFLGAEISPVKRRMLDEFYNDSEQYLLNRQLICLTNVRELEFVRNPGSWDVAGAYALLSEMRFESILKKFDEWIVPWEKARLDADVPALP